MSNKKNTWVKESGFIFAMIGSAVGFANILAFSAQCYKNGGGAFLIPFLAAVLIIGLPMLLLEGAIGNKFELPIVSAYGKVLNKNYKIFGWISALSCLTIGSFYSVLTSWSMSYTYFAATGSIKENSADFFQNVFLNDSGSLTAFNNINWHILAATLVVFLFSWIVNSKNISSGIEKVCSIFLPLLFILVIFFTIVVVFLPGASEGFYHYLKPDFSKLKNFQLWRDVFGHVFFSFSLGIGIVVGYSRHTKKETNVKRAMLLVAFGDVLISVIAGFAIFGCVGYMSHKTGIPFHEIVKSDSTFDMGFIIFPQILTTFDSWLQPIIGSVFFFCVFIAGITGVFSIIESVAGSVEIEFNYSRIKSVTITIIAMALLSILFCMGNGTRILGALTPMVMGYAFLIGGIAQTFAFIYFNQSLKSEKVFLNKKGKQSINYYLVKYFGLMFLFISFFGALMEEIKEPIDAASIVRWSWFFIVLIIAFILAQKNKI